MTSLTQPAPTAPGCPLPPVRRPRPSAYPVEPTIYPHALRSPRSRWWRGALALVLLVVGFLLASLVFSVPALVYDFARNGTFDKLASGAAVDLAVTMSPALFLANNLALAAMVPISVGIQALVFGQRPRFLSSVQGRFRWSWLLRAAVVVAPVYAVFTVVWFAVDGSFAPTLTPTTVAYLVIVLVTTPLQAAGEEYATRGLANRAVGSWFTRAVPALVVGGLVNSALFMLAHGAGDPWLIGYYFFFGVIMTVLAWRTGGLEVPILLHTVNNVFLLVPTALSGQMDQIMNRGAGTGSPAMLIPMAVAVLTVVAVEWRARRTGVATRTSPAAMSRDLAA